MFNDLLLYGGTTTIICIIVAIIIYLLPTFILCSTLWKIARFFKYPQELKVSFEGKEHFACNGCVFIYKKYYDEETNTYITPYGVFIPIYSTLNNTVIKGFIYKKN
ncbi:MAG: hypothetical protein J6A73_08460 [Lachnospiraceae bacterium]|nr:hypothetical protein [Lachnospiraceae bacterium]